MSQADKRHIEKTRKKTGRAIELYQLIQDGDKILVAISGGKDSLSLLEILHNRQRIIPIKYSLEAVHFYIKDNPEYSNIQYIKHFCNNFNIPLHLPSLQTTPSPRDGKSPCFVCTWHRRKEIFKTAQGIKANKVAMGHHLDDVLQTLLMNMNIHGEFSSMPPRLFFEKGNFEIIRPLILLTENEIARYASLLDIRNAGGSCPHEEANQREAYKPIVKELAALHKTAKMNLYKSMSHINTKYLPPFTNSRIR